MMEILSRSMEIHCNGSTNVTLYVKTIQNGGVYLLCASERIVYILISVIFMYFGLCILRQYKCTLRRKKPEQCRE